MYELKNNRHSYRTICSIEQQLVQKAFHFAPVVCRNGDAMFENTSNAVTALCYEGVWYNIQSGTVTGDEAPIFGSEVVAPILGSLLALCLLVLACMVIAVWVVKRRRRKSRTSTYVPTQLIE